MAQNGVNKARYWWAVLYPENMVEGWEDKIDDLLQVPFCYCIHSADTDTKSEHRKDHIHLIMVFPNTTTYKHALNIFKLLGEKAVNTCKACINVRHCYDYLIHDTDSCRKAGKHLYDPSERVCGNCFDIGAYEQIGTEERLAMLQELIAFAIDRRIMNMSDFTIEAGAEFDASYFSVVVGYNAVIARIVKGNFLKYGQKDK